MLGLIESPASKKYYYDVPHRYDDWFTAWGNVAQKYKDYPALGGWFMGDESTAAVIESLAKAKSEILKYDASHVALANLFAKYSNEVKGDPVGEHEQLNGRIEPSPEVSTPSTVPNLVNGFDEYYDYFGDVFGPAIWLSDLYPFGTAYGYVLCNLDEEFYEYLLRIKNFSTKTGRPLWTFVACNLEFKPSEKDENGKDKYNNAELASHIDALSIGRLRFQTFMALAYGAQGICYWNIFGDGDKYMAMPVDLNGFKTSLFDIVKTVNEEIKSYNSVFCGCKVLNLGVLKSSKQNDNKEKLPLIKLPFGIIKEAKYDSSTRWIVSVLQNNGVKYMVIINCDYEKGHQINLQFVESLYSVWKFYGNSSYSPAITGVSEYIEAGGMVVYRFKENP